MAIRKGLPAKNAATDADDTRYLFSGLVACNVDGSPRGGLLSPVGTSLVAATATMNVTVARFQAAAVRDGGVVLLANDGTANVLLDAAPVANSRIDVIFAKQNDSSATVAVPDANNSPVLGVVKGTAAAVPVKPSLPSGALELATVEIPSSATATNSGGVVITQTASFTAASGAIVPFRTKTSLEAWTTAQGDQLAMVLSTHEMWRFNGTSWVALSQSWVPWTPTLQNFNSLGTTGSVFGEYKVENGFCSGLIIVQYSGSGMVTPVTGWGFSLPHPIRSALTGKNHKIGEGLYRDANVGNTSAGGNVDLSVVVNGDTGFAGFRQPYSGSAGISDYGYLSAAVSGVPSPANGDYVTARFSYAV